MAASLTLYPNPTPTPNPNPIPNPALCPCPYPRLTLQLVQRPVGRMPLHIPPADEPTKFKKRLDARRAEAAAEAAEAKAAEEARRRRMRRIASAPALTDEQVLARQLEPQP